MKIPYLNRHLYVLWLKKPLSEKRLVAIKKGKAWIKKPSSEADRFVEAVMKATTPDLPEKEKTE